MALQAIGGVLQSVAAAQAQARANQVFQDEMDRQTRYGNESYGVFGKGLQQSGAETAQMQMQQGQSKREKMYSDLAGAQPMGGSNSGPTARGQAEYKQLGQNRAALGSYSDWELMQHINTIRTQDELNRISDFSKGSAGVLPMALDQAQHSQDELAFFGSLVSSVGGGSGSFDQMKGKETPAMYGARSNSGPGVQGGYDYNLYPSTGSDGNPYNPYSLFA